MTVSGSDSYALDDQIYRTSFDPSTESPCAAVVEAIEAAGSCETPVLADSIDPDTLTQLYRDDGCESWMLSFDHAGLEVTVWGTGRIHVDTTAIATAVGPDGQSGDPNSQL